MRYIEVTMPDATVWRVDPHYVAYFVSEHIIMNTPFISISVDDKIFGHEYPKLLQSDDKLLEQASRIDWSVLVENWAVQRDAPASREERRELAMKYKDAWATAPKRVVTEGD